jgi:putative ABC transport system substrate-binding protein
MLRMLAAVLGVACLVLQYDAAAQTTRVHRVGLIGPPAGATMADVFRKALLELGYTDGVNLVIETRWPESEQLELQTEAARTLLERKADVLVVVGATVARAARVATKDVPIVFVIAIDPVATGLVASIDRPGGNLTGTTTFDPQQARRQLETLKIALPGVERIALLGDAGAVPTLFLSNEEAARALGLQSVTFKVERVANPDFEAAIAAAKQARAEALVVLSTPVTTGNRKRIAELAIRERMPTLAPRDHADAGMLFSYGTSFGEATRRAASHVDRILKGANPGELPVETVTRHELVVNMKTAQAIGVNVPEAVVSSAGQVMR